MIYMEGIGAEVFEHLNQKENTKPSFPELT